MNEKQLALVEDQLIEALKKVRTLDAPNDSEPAYSDAIASLQYSVSVVMQSIANYEAASQSV